MQPPLIAHVIFDLGVGGLENGLINLINCMPVDRYRHAIVCVKGASGFERRLQRSDVEIVQLHKAPGLGLSAHLRAWREFRRLRPTIVHTRNIAALEMMMPAWLARVPVRIHSEHGRDGKDIGGHYWRHNVIRKALRPFVHQYLAMSRNLMEWLVDTIGIERKRVAQIYSGVDTARFAARQSSSGQFGPEGFLEGAPLVVGAVGRMVAIKDHITLVQAFARLVEKVKGRRQVRLVIVGDGPERAACERAAADLGVDRLCWFAGQRSDIDALLPQMQVFCLTSLNEGINNTILEAMSSALPVVATAAGGNPELVIDGRTGTLVPVQDAEALANALLRYADDDSARRLHGEEGRQRIEREFSLEAMVAGYLRLYDQASGKSVGIA